MNLTMKRGSMNRSGFLRRAWTLCLAEAGRVAKGRDCAARGPGVTRPQLDWRLTVASRPFCFCGAKSSLKWTNPKKPKPNRRLETTRPETAVPHSPSALGFRGFLWSHSTSTSSSAAWPRPWPRWDSPGLSYLSQSFEVPIWNSAWRSCEPGLARRSSLRYSRDTRAIFDLASSYGSANFKWVGEAAPETNQRNSDNQWKTGPGGARESQTRLKSPAMRLRSPSLPNSLLS